MAMVKWFALHVNARTERRLQSILRYAQAQKKEGQHLYLYWIVFLYLVSIKNIVHHD